MKIIVEGVDRLGKDTLIAGLQDRFGFLQEIHYQKPKRLAAYDGSLKAYQEESFHNLIELLESDANLIFNRAHLGEAVYSHRYRGYDGNYVFDLERMLSYRARIDTVLILLYTSDFSFITDDGESFDFSAKEAEQEEFLRAFERSRLRSFKVDVAKNGAFKFKDDLRVEVIQRLITLNPSWELYGRS